MEQSHLTEDMHKLRDSLGPLPEPVVHAFLIVVSGLPGTGKSYFCRRLAERLPVAILESDALRKVLFPHPHYNRSESSHLFQACHHLIEQLLQSGIPLVLDATNLEEHHREYLYHIVDRLEAKLVLVKVDAPPEVVRQRLEQRLNRTDAGDTSEADWKVYLKMKRTAQTIRRNYFSVDTSRDINPVIDKIVRAVSR